MADAIVAANLAMAVLALALCGWHAWGDRDRLALLGTLTVYGVVLEQLVILRFDRYVYNVSDFLLTVGDVPVVIGFGWAAIIYSGIVVGGHVGLRGLGQVAFVGLYALHIDLAIDAVAIRVPFWSWQPPGVWFGVPLGNFVGWLLVATLFAAGWLLFRDRAPGVLAAPGAMLFALAGLVVGLEAWELVGTADLWRAVVLCLVVATLVALVARDGITGRPRDWRLSAVPALYHGAYLLYFLALGMYREVPVLLAVSLAMVALTASLHTDLPARASRRLGTAA
jgi:putative membrane protein